MAVTANANERIAIMAQETARKRMRALPPGPHDEARAIFRSCVFHEELMQRAKVSLPSDLTRTQMSLMTTLDALGPLAMTPLSECIAVPKEQASRSVKPLIERGLVERRRSERNHRVVVVKLTPAGASLLDEIMALNLAALDELLAPLSPEERSELARLCCESDRLIAKALAARRNPYENA